MCELISASVLAPRSCSICGVAAVITQKKGVLNACHLNVASYEAIVVGGQEGGHD